MSMSLLEKMRNIFNSNAVLQRAAQANPSIGGYLESGTGVRSFLYSLYVENNIVLASVPALRDPELLVQIEEETRFSEMGRGSIFEWAGVKEHARFNGRLRPVIQFNK